MGDRVGETGPYVNERGIAGLFGETVSAQRVTSRENVVVSVWIDTRGCRGSRRCGASLPGPPLAWLTLDQFRPINDLQLSYTHDTLPFDTGAGLASLAAMTPTLISLALNHSRPRSSTILRAENSFLANNVRSSSRQAQGSM